MKKTICIFLCVFILALLFSTASMAAGVPTITADTVTAAAGETVQIGIRLQDNPGIVSMTLKISYDSTALTLVNVTDGGILGTQSHKPQYNNPYTLAWVNDTATTNFTGNGLIATLTFEVKSTAEPGQEYPVTISYDNDNYDIYNKDIECVNFARINGFVTVKKSEPEIAIAPITDFTYRFVHGGIHITGYLGDATDLYIAETYEINGRERDVTGIDESAFEANETITSVTLPATIEFIGDYAFYDCTSLTDVTLWSKNAEIGEKAFGYYYISRKKDGKVDDFTLTTYHGGTVSDYLSANGLVLNNITTPIGLGDVDADGEYSAADLVVLTRHMLDTDPLTGNKLGAADLNGDGVTNILDLIRLKKNLAG